MAVLLLRSCAVLVAVAAAVLADDPGTVWAEEARALLPCVVPGRAVAPRRPPPPLDADAHDRDQPPLRHSPYLWRHGKNHMPHKRVLSNGTLVLPRQLFGEGIYQCELQAAPGRVLGYPVHLRFPSMEKQFSVQPRDQSALAGQPLALPCFVESAPPADLTWLRDGLPLPPDPRYHLLPSELVIVAAQTTDTGEYRCVARNERAKESLRSEAARVVVSAPEPTPAGLLPVLGGTNVSVAAGGSVTLACPVLGWPRPTLSWEFRKPGQRMQILESEKEILVLYNVTEEDSGMYICRLDDHRHLHKMYAVEVWQPVSLEYGPQSRQALRASTVRFECSARGQPAPHIAWYKDARPLNITGRTKILLSSTSGRMELVIGSITSDDAGTYQCFAQNGRSAASGWAQLNVTGGGAPEPVDVRCAPASATAVHIYWHHRDPAGVLAYTVHYAPRDGNKEMTGAPLVDMNVTITVEEALVPYKFQVRAYRKSSASDLSAPVQCQGQGVPVQLWRTVEGFVSVSWLKFAEHTNAIEWILQLRTDAADAASTNITLPGNTTNYTLEVPTDKAWLVRVLGSRDGQWPPQNLTLVKWTSTSDADQDHGQEDVTPTSMEVVRVWPRGALLSWRHGAGREPPPGRFVFVLCVRQRGRLEETCQQSFNNSAEVESLQPNTQYEVRVQALGAGRAPGAAFSQPFLIATPPEESHRFREVRYAAVNATTVRVWWRVASAGDQLFTVRYSPRLTLPVDEWRALNVTATEALVPVGSSERAYVMVTAYGPTEHSLVMSVTKPARASDATSADTQGLQNIHYEYRDDGVSLLWAANEGGSPDAIYNLKNTHNLTLPIERWTECNVTRAQLYDYHLGGSQPGLWRYVQVTSLEGDRPSRVLTVSPAPPAQSDSQRHQKHALLLGVCVGVGVCALFLLAGGALCVLRRRRKRQRNAASRRSEAAHDSPQEGSEMKSIGGRLANGGRTLGAGEPLLNGHVHITENPALAKTPNGKLRKARRPNYDAFDLSRPIEESEVPDLPVGAVLLDTSRPRADSYNKLPDNNMNSELGGDAPTPTLQPNG